LARASFTCPNGEVIEIDLLDMQRRESAAAMNASNRLYASRTFADWLLRQLDG